MLGLNFLGSEVYSDKTTIKLFLLVDANLWSKA